MAERSLRSILFRGAEGSPSVEVLRGLFHDNTIQLLDLPLSMTESKLGSLVGELDGCRKVEMEPGFAVHFSRGGTRDGPREMVVVAINLGSRRGHVDAYHDAVTAVGESSWAHYLTL